MYKAIPLPYDYSALEPYIDAETMKVHYSVLYMNYIKNLNTELTKSDKKFIPIKQLIYKIDNYSNVIRNNAGGYYNHSLFWQMLENPKTKRGYFPYGISYAVINRDFGNFENFKIQIKEKAKKRFGSGWVWWILMPDGYTNIVETPYQDNPQMYDVCEILLGIDVWEHAYFLKYQADRMTYVDNTFNVIDWDYPNSILNLYFN